MIIVEGNPVIKHNNGSRPVGLALAQYVKVRTINHRDEINVSVDMVVDVDWNPAPDLIFDYCELFGIDADDSGLPLPLAGQLHLPNKANYVACDGFVRWFEKKPTFHENLYIWAEDDNDVMKGVNRYGTRHHIKEAEDPTQTLMRIWK